MPLVARTATHPQFLWLTLGITRFERSSQFRCSREALCELANVLALVLSKDAENDIAFQPSSYALLAE